jgi:predicted amino acid-binding ACT domain protein
MQITTQSTDQLSASTLAAQSASDQLRQGQAKAAEAGLAFARQSVESALRGATLISILGGDSSGLLSVANSALASVEGNVKTIADGIAGNLGKSATANDKANAQRQLTQLQQQVQRIKINADTLSQIAIYHSGDSFCARKNRATRDDLDASFSHAGNIISAARFAVSQAKQSVGPLAFNLVA